LGHVVKNWLDSPLEPEQKPEQERGAGFEMGWRCVSVGVVNSHGKTVENVLGTVLAQIGTLQTMKVGTDGNTAETSFDSFRN